MNFKQKICNCYLEMMASKILLLEKTIADLRESSSNETKSSAGDKYETTREMIKQEEHKISHQLNETKEQKAFFELIDFNSSSHKINKGRLVKTNKGYFLLSLALGKIILDGETIIAISLQSPLGKLLVGLQVGDNVEVNGMEYVIEVVA